MRPTERLFMRHRGLGPVPSSRTQSTLWRGEIKGKERTQWGNFTGIEKKNRIYINVCICSMRSPSCWLRSVRCLPKMSALHLLSHFLPCSHVHTHTQTHTILSSTFNLSSFLWSFPILNESFSVFSVSFHAPFSFSHSPISLLISTNQQRLC